MKTRYQIHILNFCLLSVAMMIALNACDTSSGRTAGTQSAPTPIPAPIIQSQTRNEHGDGGIDSGGGNFVGSDAEQIKAIFHGENGFSLKDAVKDVFKSVEFQVLNKTLTPESESLFSRMLGSKFSGDSVDIFQDIELSPYELKETGPCHAGHSYPNDARHSKDASTKLNQKGASICFSLEGLKRLPIQAVPFQIVALAIHEHAHHYGFDEDDAVLAQNEALKLMNQGLLNGIYMETVSTAASLRDRLMAIRKNLADTDKDTNASASLSDKMICKHLSALEALAQRLNTLSEKIDRQFEVHMLVTALDHKFSIKKESLSGTKEVLFQIRGLLDFCGKDPLDRPTYGDRVPEGDRKKLEHQLESVLTIAHQIVRAATSAAKRDKVVR